MKTGSCMLNNQMLCKCYLCENEHDLSIKIKSSYVVVSMEQAFELKTFQNPLRLWCEKQYRHTIIMIV